MPELPSTGNVEVVTIYYHPRLFDLASSRKIQRNGYIMQCTPLDSNTKCRNVGRVDIVCKCDLIYW